MHHLLHKDLKPILSLQPKPFIDSKKKTRESNDKQKKQFNVREDVKCRCPLVSSGSRMNAKKFKNLKKPMDDQFEQAG